MRNAVSFLALLLVLGQPGVWSVHAFRPPESEPLPDFDKRGLALPQAKPINPDQQAGLDRLAERVPGVRVAFEGKLGTPRFIHSSQGFLSGPDGQGGAISALAAAAIPAQDPHRPIKAFLNEHASLLGHGAEILQSARITREFVTPHNGMRTVVWEQVLDGVPVYQRILIGHITRRGELVNLSCQFLPNLAGAADAGLANRAAVLANPPISAGQALVLAAPWVEENVALGQLTRVAGIEPGPVQRHVFRVAALPGDNDARLVWVPFSRTQLRLCWQVVLTSRSRGEMFLCMVDAETGEVILRRCLTEYLTDVTYNVFTSDSPSPFTPGHPFPNTAQPPLVARQLVTLSALNTNASPNGWIDDAGMETMGNNVDAHLDRNADNQPDLPRPSSTNRVFDFALDLTMEPSTYGDASVVQLFYLNNWMHDKLYELGFTEAAGNFQVDNFGRGGLGNDAVQADCQDGTGFNNANFATPPDGMAGRMQMYLFDGTTPDRDGSLDAEVVFHEYTHGLSNRRVGGGGGLTALQSRGMGEGWSDFYPMALLSESTDDVDAAYPVGGYVTYNFYGLTENYYFGIRRYPVSTDLTNKNPLTFKDIDPNQADPHVGVPLSPLDSPWSASDATGLYYQGSLWCNTLWQARANLIKKFGFTMGNQLILQLVTDGMNLSPPDPNFLEARDAIIQADLVNNGGANFDQLWAAFAKRGMGGSAYSPDSTTTRGVEESFDLPGLALSRAVATDLSGNANGAIDFNECIDLEILLLNNGRLTASNVTAFLTTTNPLVSISQPSSSYPNVAPGTVATNRVPFRFSTAPDYPCGEPITLFLQVSSGQGSRIVRVILNTGLVGSALRFDNNTPLPIPDGDYRGVSSPMNVAGFAGNLAKATVSLHILHPFDFDLDIRLVAPDGTRVVLSQFNGFFGQNYGVACSPEGQRTTFDDKAPIAIAAGRPPYVGSFRPDEPLAAFNGKSGAAVNGVWRLEIADVFSFDEGSLQCWSLHLSPYLCRDGGGDCSTDLALSLTNSPPPILVDSNFSYFISVTNLGPNTARNVLVQDPLPPGLTYVSATASQGACSEIAGTVGCNLGTLANGQSASVQIVVRASEIGFFTNTVSVSSTVSDPRLNNNTATAVTRIFPPTPFLISAGTFLVSESLAPANGGIDLGETITLSFSLQNVGSLDTSNLVAKLQATGGVTAPSPQQEYGVVVAGGPPLSRAFTFVASGTNGGLLTATLQLQDGTNNLGFLSFTYALGSVYRLVNQSVINVPDQGSSSLYPSPLFLSGLNGLIDSVLVTLSNVTHSFPQDLDILLAGPAGRPVMLMSDAGGGSPMQNVTFTLDDAAAQVLPVGTLITPGSYRPADYQPGDVLPPPAPPGPYATNLSVLRGTDPNGTWALYAADDTRGDLGRITGGWNLQVRTFDPVNPQADLAVSATAAPLPVLVSSNLTFTVTVTNRGPETAPEVVLTNSLPATVRFVSATGSGATCTNVEGKVLCTLGSLAPAHAATVDLVVAPETLALVSVTSDVAGLVMDFYPSNNRTVTLAGVTAAADLQVSVLSSPEQPTVGNPLTYTVLVTNQGPSDASNVFVTNTLPAGVTFVSATPSQGTCNRTGSRVTCSLGGLLSQSGAHVDIVVTPPAVATLTSRTAVRALSPADPVPINNSATNVLSVINPLYTIVPADTRLIAESMAPPSGGIDIGETVTVSLGLRNTGTDDTANLVATLLEAGGVANPSGSATYGVLPALGPTVAMPFTFVATGTGGGQLTALLRVQDGPIDLGTVTFTFALGGVNSFANTNAVLIPDTGKTIPYPSIITVSNVAGLVEKATVTLHGLTHAYPDDLDLLLVSPAGQPVLLMSDVGGGNPVDALTIVLDQAGPTNLPDLDILVPGTYRPTDYELNDLFPAPAPTGPYSTDLATLRDTAPNGDWALYVVDDTVGDLGQIAGGWELALATYGPLELPPVVLHDPELLSDGRFRFTLQGTPGRTYLIQTSTNFESWTDLGSYPLTGESTVVVDPDAGTFNRRFYRALAQP